MDIQCKYNKIYLIFLMSHIFEDCARPLFVRCEDVGLNCDGIIYGKNRETVMDLTIMQMFEYHAICPEEMTTFMRLKIRGRIYACIVIRCAHKCHTRSIIFLKIITGYLNLT